MTLDLATAGNWPSRKRSAVGKRKNKLKPEPIDHQTTLL
jgi:hypothetical protein